MDGNWQLRPQSTTCVAKLRRNEPSAQCSASADSAFAISPAVHLGLQLHTFSSHSMIGDLLSIAKKDTAKKTSFSHVIRRSATRAALLRQPTERSTTYSIFCESCRSVEATYQLQFSSMPSSSMEKFQTKREGHYMKGIGITHVQSTVL